MCKGLEVRVKDLEGVVAQRTERLERLEREVLAARLHVITERIEGVEREVLAARLCVQD
jgi:hypothetical protein